VQRACFVSWVVLLAFLFEETSPFIVQNINLPGEPGRNLDLWLKASSAREIGDNRATLCPDYCNK
jgi:hypothetical protein